MLAGDGDLGQAVSARRPPPVPRSAAVPCTTRIAQPDLWCVEPSSDRLTRVAIAAVQALWSSLRRGRGREDDVVMPSSPTQTQLICGEQAQVGPSVSEVARAPLLVFLQTGAKRIVWSNYRNRTEATCLRPFERMAT